MQSKFALTPQIPIVKYKRSIKACHFISLGVAMSCCTILNMHDVHSVCFVNTDLRSLAIPCIIYTCATSVLHANQRWAFILNLIVGSSVGCPLNSPLFPYLKVVGCPLSCPLCCPLYPYMEVIGSLICMTNIRWAAHWQPIPLLTELPTQLPTPLPTEPPIYGISWQPNLHGKIPMDSPWASH